VHDKRYGIEEKETAHVSLDFFCVYSVGPVFVFRVQLESAMTTTLALTMHATLHPAAFIPITMQITGMLLFTPTLHLTTFSAV
jgi:hypothetical protein